MKLTIHRGTHEIGGNCVEIATAATRVVLDVGLPFDRIGKGASGQSQDVDERISAIFRKSPPVSAVILSHAHADHTGLLNLVPSNVPIYCSEGTSMMMKAGWTYARQKDVPRTRKRILTEREPARIGDITVMGHPVDHSAFGSMALEIEADGQRILYSGDLRLHGRKPGMARKLFHSLRGKVVDVLLMEGTHFSGNRLPGPTEKELEELILADIKSAPNLVLASFSPMHVDRLVAFYKATRRAGRVFAVDHYAGFVLHLVSKIAKIPRPLASERIRVFRPKFQKLSPTVSRCFPGSQITLKDILADPRRYVMLFRPSMLKSDFPAGLPEHVRCLYSYWSGYLDNTDWLSTRAKIQEAGGDLVERHTSGHIFRRDVAEFIRRINYRIIIPIHTTMPEAFEPIFKHTRLLTDGQEIDLNEAGRVATGVFHPGVQYSFGGT